MQATTKLSSGLSNIRADVDRPQHKLVERSVTLLEAVT